MTAQPVRINVTPNTDEWLQARKKGLGGSDAAAVVGLSPWKEPVEVYQDKLGMIPPLEMTSAMERGHLFEGEGARKWRERFPDYDTEPSALIRHPKYEWMLATPDLFVPDADRLVQIKTASAWTLPEWGEDGSSDIPDHYDIQVRHEMAVANAASVDVAVLFATTEQWDLLVAMKKGGAAESMIQGIVDEHLEFRVYHIERDMEVERDLIAMEQDFWENHILAEVEPEDIAVMKDSGKTRKAGAAEIKKVAVALKHWLALERAKMRLEASKAWLKTAIGEDSGLDCGGGHKVTWKKTKDKEVDTVFWEGLAKKLRQRLDLPEDEWKDLVQLFTTTNTKEGVRRFLWPTTVWKKELVKKGKK
jgi:putative phage-type endonuclease